MTGLLILALLAQPCPNKAQVLRSGQIASCDGVQVSKTMIDRAVETKAELEACGIMRIAEGKASQLRLAWAAASAQMRRAALLRSTERMIEVVEVPAEQPWYLHPVMLGLAAGAAVGAAGFGGYLIGRDDPK